MKFYCDTESSPALYVKFSEADDDTTLRENLDTTSYGLAALIAEYVVSVSEKEDYHKTQELLMDGINNYLEMFLDLLPGIHRLSYDEFQTFVDVAKQLSTEQLAELVQQIREKLDA